MDDAELDLVATEQDDRLMAELRAAAAERDAVPELVLAAAQESLTWRTIDAELAALAFDSATDEGAALVRDGAAASTYRHLTFEVGDVAVEVEVATTASGRRLVAQVIPPAVAEVEVRTPVGVVLRETDEAGRLASVDVAPGPVSLRIRLLPDGPTVVTEWVTA